jgi:hypothetical protein
VRARGGLRRGRCRGEPDSSLSPGPARGRTKGLIGGPHLSARDRERRREGHARELVGWGERLVAVCGRGGRGKKAARAGP